MSINITVNGNPVSMRNGKMVLSDLENIKKTEREHRKRLRLEQVNFIFSFSFLDSVFILASAILTFNESSI